MILLYSLPVNKILALSKLKAFAKNSFGVAQVVQVLFGRVENILVKLGSAGSWHFPIFPLMFLKDFFSYRL